MEPVRVAPERWNFQKVDRGEPISSIGGNRLDDQHPARGTLFQGFDVSDCERRSAAMAEVGLNSLRQAIGVNAVFEQGKRLVRGSRTVTMRDLLMGLYTCRAYQGRMAGL